MSHLHCQGYHEELAQCIPENERHDIVWPMKYRRSQFYAHILEVHAIHLLSLIQCAESGGVRPFGVSLMMAGYDDNGPQLYQIDPSGTYFAWKASAIGKNMVSLDLSSRNPCQFCMPNLNDSPSWMLHSMTIRVSNHGC